jgi:hypothetical protein
MPVSSNPISPAKPWPPIRTTMLSLKQRDVSAHGYFHRSARDDNMPYQRRCQRFRWGILRVYGRRVRFVTLCVGKDGKSTTT